MQVRDHRLYEDNRAIPFLPSPHSTEGLQPLYLIVHYTAALTLRSTVGWFLDARAKASAHLIVDRNGDAVQMVSLDRRAWHAGTSRWDILENLNAYSIGIELVNGRALERSPTGEWIDWAGHVIRDEEVLVARHKRESMTRGWHVFPEIQIARGLEIATAMHEEYRFRDVLGHEDVAPDRKIDPGPACPLMRFASDVLGAGRVIGRSRALVQPIGLFVEDFVPVATTSRTLTVPRTASFLRRAM